MAQPSKCVALLLVIAFIMALFSMPILAVNPEPCEDAVGSDGVTIRHLLIVPDATSSHNLDADFAAYIDDIVISDDDKPFFTTSGAPGGRTRMTEVGGF